MTLEGQERDGAGAAGEMGQKRVSEVGIAASGFERQMSDAAERMERLVRGGASPQETGWAEEGLLRACARAPLPTPQRGMGRVTRVGDCRSQWG